MRIMATFSLKWDLGHPTMRCRSDAAAKPPICQVVDGGIGRHANSGGGRTAHPDAVGRRAQASYDPPADAVGDGLRARGLLPHLALRRLDQPGGLVVRDP